MKIIGLGDSIMAFNGCHTYPQTGWLQKLPLFLNPTFNITVEDFAQNGRSTKSFIDEGYFDKVMKEVRWGDLCVISFGHNDEKVDPLRHTDRDTTFLKNIEYMTKRLKSKGADVVFVTSWPRLIYSEKGSLDDTHLGYPQSMKKWAEEQSYKCVDLNEIGLEYLRGLPKEKARELFMCLPSDKYDNYQEGVEDTSHLNDYGAFIVCRLVVNELRKYPDYARYFI